MLHLYSYEKNKKKKQPRQGIEPGTSTQSMAQAAALTIRPREHSECMRYRVRISRYIITKIRAKGGLEPAVNRFKPKCSTNELTTLNDYVKDKRFFSTLFLLSRESTFSYICRSFSLPHTLSLILVTSLPMTIFLCCSY